jgi:acetyltransferase-like isoleucine patch superfamily enzyme
VALKDKLKGNPALKKFVHWMLIPTNQARPRLWVQWFVNPFYHKKGKGASICRYARMDVLPFNHFEIGAYSTIEDFSVVNNGVGPVSIGSNTRIGLGNVLIGPVKVGNQVILAQNVVLSGLNHGYEDINTPIRLQKVTTAQITVEDEVWIGANAVLTAGITIGKHSVVAGGSVVTKSVPAYSVVGGNPAKILKQYNAQSGLWERV